MSQSHPVRRRVRAARTVRILVLLFSVLAPVSAGAAARPGSEDAALARRVDTWARPLVERGELSGQLLIARGGRVVLERSFGFADRELGVRVTPETRFNVASVTKPMTVIATIGLIQLGRLAVTDSIARWIPDFPKGDSIRVTHLLRHRSGIPHDIVPDSMTMLPATTAGIVEHAKRLTLDFPVGSRESYSSGGFEVLARVLELASGKTYAELLDEWVFRPAGMTHSAAAPDNRVILAGRARAYVPGPHGFENAALEDFSWITGAGSVWSTARDLHSLVQAIVAGRMVPGARESFVRGGRLDCNGRVGGFKAWAMWDSAGAVEAIFLGNAATGAPDLLKREVLRLARGEPVPPPALPEASARALTLDEMRRWEGDYRIENGGPLLHVRIREGVLWSNDWVMWPTADGGLYSPRDYGVIRAIEGAGGTIAKLDWLQGTQHYLAPRLAPGER